MIGRNLPISTSEIPDEIPQENLQKPLEARRVDPYTYEIIVPTKEGVVAIIRKFVTDRYPHRAHHVQPGGMLDPDKYSCLQIGDEARWFQHQDGSFCVKIRGNDAPLSDRSVQWLKDEGYLDSNEGA